MNVRIENTQQEPVIILLPADVRLMVLPGPNGFDLDVESAKALDAELRTPEMTQRIADGILIVEGLEAVQDPDASPLGESTGDEESGAIEAGSASDVESADGPTGVTAGAATAKPTVQGSAVESVEPVIDGDESQGTP